MVVGKGEPGEELSSLFKDPSIEFVGMVPDVGEWYAKASLAIIPLQSGSGTRLKLLEAMSNRVPCISTTTGAEGIDFESGTHILISNDPADFAKKAVSLLKEDPLRINIANNAFHFVQQNFDWNLIGNKIKSFLNTALFNQGTGTVLVN
jgi:glycosyltransferase involved in cell wall biosynthesis